MSWRFVSSLVKNGDQLLSYRCKYYGLYHSSSGIHHSSFVQGSDHIIQAFIILGLHFLPIHHSLSFFCNYLSTIFLLYVYPYHFFLWRLFSQLRTSLCFILHIHSIPILLALFLGCRFSIIGI